MLWSRPAAGTDVGVRGFLSVGGTEEQTRDARPAKDVAERKQMVYLHTHLRVLPYKVSEWTLPMAHLGIQGCSSGGGDTHLVDTRPLESPQLSAQGEPASTVYGKD